MTIDIGALILLAFLLGIGICMLINIVNQMEERVKKLENSLKQLEENQAKRLPHNSAAAIEDGISTILNAKRMHDELKTELDAMGFWLEKGAEYLQGARGNQYYDQNIPTGNRAKRK